MTRPPLRKPPRQNAAQSISRHRHIGGFVLAGGTALVIDISVLTAMMSWFAWSAEAARIIAIATAMVASWLINRTVTFAVEAPPSIGEFAKFAAASWLAQAVNYAAFITVLTLQPNTIPAIAVIVASLIAMMVAYAAFRYGVFRGITGPPHRETAATDRLGPRTDDDREL